MNSRIKELMKEANKDIPLGKPFWSALEEFSEKFAELIVTECCNVARRTILSGSGVNPNTFAGTVTTVQEIKKHFRVEE